MVAAIGPEAQQNTVTGAHEQCPVTLATCFNYPDTFDRLSSASDSLTSNMFGLLVPVTPSGHKVTGEQGEEKKRQEEVFIGARHD